MNTNAGVDGRGAESNVLSMETVTLRMLLRQPGRVKKLTRAGKTVHVTDNGQPLWIITSAEQPLETDGERAAAIDAILDEVLNAKPSSLSLSKIVLDSRR